MIRTAVLAAFVAVAAGAALAQDVVTLHIKVTLLDAARTPVPIARAALLISDEPATAAPRRVVTAADGTATIRLRPGNYFVESDDPVAFGGEGYEWRLPLKVAAGRDATLDLTAANAEVGAAPAASVPSTAGVDAADTAVRGVTVPPQARDSVVAVWTAESRASGFLYHAAGLVATSQRVVGTATSAEVQLAPTVKVAARVLASDAARDVAILWIDPAPSATMRPLALECATAAPPLKEGQKVVALGAPLRGPKEVSPGDVIDAHEGVADFRLADGSLGGPVYTGSGVLAGLSSEVESQHQVKDARVVPIADVCAVATMAEKVMQTAHAPAVGPLPVEPMRRDPETDAKVLDDVVKGRQGSLNPYQAASANFDVAFLTPVVIRGAQQTEAKRGRVPLTATAIVATDFGEWSDYFDEVPPVLVVRVTPKMAEGFWTTVARGAAYTQGMRIPAIKHFKPGFLRLRAFCGDTEVTPIHPFTLTHPVSATDAIREGLYVFDPQAFGPQCASVKLQMYSEKEPAKPDTLVVAPNVLDHIRDDFAYLGPL